MYYYLLAMRRSGYHIIGVFLGVILLVNLFFDNPIFDKLTDKAAFEIKTKQTREADETLLQLALQHRLNITHHYNYINNHFDIPDVEKVGKHEYKHRDDSYISNLYSGYCDSVNVRISDIGHYGKGLILVNQKKYKSAIIEFQKVRNGDLNYLNNSLGNAYEHLKKPKLAKLYFKKEIRNKGNLNGAYSNIFGLLVKQKNWNEASHYLNNSEIIKYLSSKDLRTFYFNNGQIFSYLATIIYFTFSTLNFWGFMAALLIMVSWVYYLRKLDLFEVEKWKHLLFALFSGMVFCFLVYPLSDINNNVFGFVLNGEIINDFLYCIFGIGLIEEIVKIIPLLILIRYTKVVNEPYDYIKFASLSALGFAFVENLHYFSEDNLNIIHGRALTSVISHMFDSSIIGYGMFLNKYKLKKNPIIIFVLFLLIASFSHGFYDFWLINEKVNKFSIISVFFTLMSIGIWNTFKNNALNHSNFFDKDKLLDSENLQDYLIYSLSGILLFEYIALAYNYSPDVANNSLYVSLFSGTFIILFFSNILSKFNLVKGEWANIDIVGGSEKYVYTHLMNINYEFTLHWGNVTGINLMPNTGTIIKRITVSSETDWYVVKLNRPQTNLDYLSDTILIRTKDVEEFIHPDKLNLMSYFLIFDDYDLENKKAKRSDFKFCGWITMKRENESFMVRQSTPNEAN